MARRGRLIGKVILLCAMTAALGLLLSTRSCRSRREKPPILLHDGQWDSLHINNAIATFIIEHGYGYPVETVVQTAYVMQASMEKGKTDVNLEARRQNWTRWYEDQVRAGTVLSLGVLYEGGAQFFVVPAWVAKEYDIETIFDMREHWRLFKDPETPSKGIFYNGIIGWGCNRINAAKLEAYGLTPHYNIVSPPSAAALEAILIRSQKTRQPVFAYGWAPTALMGAHEWRILKEPAYDDECWQEIIMAAEDSGVRPLARACAYKEIPMEKMIHRGMLNKAPDVVEMLKKMQIGLKPLNKVLAWTSENEIRDWRKPALYYLRQYEDEWKTWVTPAAYGKIKAALERAPGADVHSRFYSEQ